MQRGEEVDDALGLVEPVELDHIDVPLGEELRLDRVGAERDPVAAVVSGDTGPPAHPVHAVPDVADVGVAEAVADEQEHVRQQVGVQAQVGCRVEGEAVEEVRLGENDGLRVLKVSVEFVDRASVWRHVLNEVLVACHGPDRLAVLGERTLDVAFEVGGVDRAEVAVGERSMLVRLLTPRLGLAAVKPCLHLVDEPMELLRVG